MVDYGTNVIPGPTVSTQTSGTVTISRAFTASVGLVGGYDTANGTATEEQVYEIDSLTEAGDLFGNDSELYLQSKLAFANGATEVYAVAVSETTTTESFASTSSGSLSNVPFDPTVNTEHDITAQDTSEGTSATVNIVYDDTPNAPSDANTINLNPVTKDFAADSSSSYDITYDYGDMDSAIKNSGILDEDIRINVVLTEADSPRTTLDSELDDKATNFNFSRGLSGLLPGIVAADYTNNLDSQRSIVVTSSRGTDNDGNAVRTAGAIAGHVASRGLGESATYGELTGLRSLRDDLKPSEAGDFINKQVLPLITFDSITIAKGLTTSTDTEFSRIHKAEIADEVTEVSHQAAKQFISEPNIVDNQEDLRDTVVSQLEDMATDSPPLLATGDGGQPYTVSSSLGSTDTEVDLSIGIDIVDVMETINVTISVGDVILNSSDF